MSDFKNYSSFYERDRYTESEARRLLVDAASNAIMHLLKNDDGTFSIMCHIVCEHCDYCETQGDARMRPDVEAVDARPNPYEKQEM